MFIAACIRTTTGEAYTWWSNRGQAWAKNVGWRIDYQIATPGLQRPPGRAEIYKAERFSDHAPLIIDYDFPKCRMRIDFAATRGANLYSFCLTLTNEVKNV
jgi:hypothetical protein